MPEYLPYLLMRNPADIPAEPVDAEVKTRDADGKQIAQAKTSAPPNCVAWNDLPTAPNADLGLASTERRRALRARTLRGR